MTKRQNTARDESHNQGRALKPTGIAAIDHSVRLRGGTAAPAVLAHEIEESRRLLDKGLSSEAEARLNAVISVAGDALTLIGQARCVLSESLEWQGRYNEALEAVRVYEAPDAREGLELETSLQIRVRLGLAYNYTGDYPKAIALLNAAQRDATEHGTDLQRGAACAALARVYRSINEYTIARDYLQKALESYRDASDWRGLSDVYLGFGLVDSFEGDYQSSLNNYEQALKLVGKRGAPQMLGRLYANMAGVCWFIKRPHEGIRYLKKAVHYYERTEHKANAAIGYNNLGINLTLVGEWSRAQDALKRALELAFEIDRHGAQVPMILDSLGELRILTGELEEAQNLLGRAVKLATAHGNKWYAGQARRTLGRCFLAIGDDARALAEGEEALLLAEQIGDRQAISESYLLLAEAHLRHGAHAQCQEQLEKVSEKTTESVTDIAIVGAAQRVYGLLWMALDDTARAIHHFSRSLSIFEMLGDRYRSALAHYELGMAYAHVQPRRATEFLALSVRAFRELGARLDLERAEKAIAALGRDKQSIGAEVAPETTEADALSPLITLRLAEASALRELLLRELVAVVHQETQAQKVLVAEPETTGGFREVAAYGFEADEKKRILESLNHAQAPHAAEQWALAHDAALIRLHAANSQPALLVVMPRDATLLRGGVMLDSLLRVVEMGLELCAYREKARGERTGQNQKTPDGQSVMPGFIHSSPAMMWLVDEINKIRSSDVTVLVTGESGTGKELIARAIHTLSNRRDKSFIPFNCTAVPKELSESYLFGYRKGAFTGATNDSPGVIRSASGGTLFLDEIGDLPLDLQPKLLRFLQEGEIQPLGEQRPIKVDVRVIAATNTDLEQMVAERRFREDLYYRLNVIRLHVPPLRERRSEIQPLVHHYIEHYSRKFNRREIQITPQAVDLLMVGDWPGNVRQLCNEVQRIVARAEDGTVITPQHLSRDILPIAPAINEQAQQPNDSTAATASTLSDEPLPQGSLPDAIEHLERRMIADALRKHGGNVSRAARELGLTRRGLQLKLARYEINAAASA